MPSNFLAKALRERYPRLCTFVDEGLERCFSGVEFRLEDAFLGKRAGELREGEEIGDEKEFEEYENMRVGTERRVQLPWKRGESFGLMDTLGVWGRMGLGSLGVMGGAVMDDEESSKDGGCMDTASKNLASSLVGPALWTIGGTIAAAASCLLYRGDIPGIGGRDSAGQWEEDARRFGDMGEAGAMLSVLGESSGRSGMIGKRGGVVETMTEGGSGGMPIAEVDVEVQRER